MGIHKRYHNRVAHYFIASMITLLLGAGVMGLGIYLLEKAEMGSVNKYEATFTKKDKK